MHKIPRNLILSSPITYINVDYALAKLFYYNMEIKIIFYMNITIIIKKLIYQSKNVLLLKISFCIITQHSRIPKAIPSSQTYTQKIS